MSEKRAIFVDRSFGRHYIPNALRKAGAIVEIHDDHFMPDAPDEEWLKQVSSRVWIALTKDSGIGQRTIQRLKVAEFGVRLFVFCSGNLTGSTMADILEKLTSKIERFDNKHTPPYIAKIYASGEIKLWRDRDRLISEFTSYIK